MDSHPLSLSCWNSGTKARLVDKSDMVQTRFDERACGKDSSILHIGY